MFFMVFSGFWERQDGSQQQLQSLWEVHSGQLPGEWHRQRVRRARLSSRISSKHSKAASQVCVSDDLQSICGEVPAGEIPPGVPGTQREVSEMERRGHGVMSSCVRGGITYFFYSFQPLTGWLTGCR